MPGFFGLAKLVSAHFKCPFAGLFGVCRGWVGFDRLPRLRVIGWPRLGRVGLPRLLTPVCLIGRC